MLLMMFRLLTPGIEPPALLSTAMSCQGNRAQLPIAGSIEHFDCITASNN